jgi:4-amino-4-deoxy-L-arabinose transferase-like glycosyltransferase
VKKEYYYLLFLPVLIVYVVNLFVDVMAIDASQYAEMSWEMFTTRSFLKVHLFGADYLDKPPLLFWLNSLSFYLLGAGNVSYKLPSLLFAILAIYSTYRFAKIYYSEQTALMAALMLATTEALFLITNDVRTDTILMGAVIFAIWQLAQFFETNETKNLLLGSIGIGLAMLAKGPIGLIAVSASLLPHVILSKKWNRLLDIRIAITFIIIALMLLPMCIGLYQQWGIKGLKFYFWTQSFGRITGASEWSNNPDTLFLIHTTIWAFLPWSLFLFVGWFDIAVSLFRRKYVVREIISISGFTLVLIALMLSRYQLPHYIFVVYPLGAVIASDYFVRLESQGRMKKVLSAIQLLALFAIIVVSCLLQYCLKGADLFSLLCLILLYTIVIAIVAYTNGPLKNLRNTVLYLTHKTKGILNNNKGLSPEAHIFFDIVYRNLFILSAGIMIVFGLLMGSFYFPAILKYQPGDDFGRYARQHRSSDNNYVAYFCEYGFADVFYAQQTPLFVWNADQFGELLKQKNHLIVLTSPIGIDRLSEYHVKYKIIEQRYHYPVAKLTLGFLNPATRDGLCDKLYLVEADL